MIATKDGRKPIIMYGHTGSMNRGCEAIVKSTADLLRARGRSVVLASHDAQYDQTLGVSEFTEIVPYRNTDRRNPQYALAALCDRICRGADCRQNYLHRNVYHRACASEIALAVGGDTYCYDMPYGFQYMNKAMNRRGVPTALWACSIEPEKLEHPEIREDLLRYHTIFPRESMTRNALLEYGFAETQVCLMADPAFTLTSEETPLPCGFQVNNTVGINISPIIMSDASNCEIVYQSISCLVKEIIAHTDMSVAFIPHVYAAAGHQDLQTMATLRSMMRDMADSPRIQWITDTSLSCRNLKYIISKCRFMFASRTHASIAAYSSNIPTQVIGYSIKSLGIAKDIHGDDASLYTLDYRSIRNNDDLRKRFRMMLESEKESIARLRQANELFRSRINRCADQVCSGLKKSS